MQHSLQKKHLVLLFHPDMNKSTVNRQLASQFAALPDTEVVDYYRRYPGGQIDYAAERALLLSAASVVLQFPLYWYATPPLLKAWLDQVLTPMYYVDYVKSGALLAGLPLMLSVSAGNTAEAYSREGANAATLDQLLLPLRVTAKRCGWQWQPPFYLYGANRLGAAALSDACGEAVQAVMAFHLTVR